MNKKTKLIITATLLLCPLAIKHTEANANSVNDYIVNKAKNNNWKTAPEQNQVASYLPKNSYRLGVGRPEMIINHESANDSDQGSWKNEKIYMLNNWQNAFVHNWTGSKEGTVAIADDRYLSWGAGPSGNWRGLQIEQAREISKDGFAQELLNLAGQNSRWIKAYNLPVTVFNPNTKTGTIGTHAQVSQAWGESDHMDPNGYWADMARKHFGSTYTINDFYELVKMVNNNQLEPSKPVAPTYTPKFATNQRVSISYLATGDVNGGNLKQYQNQAGTITKYVRKDQSNSRFYYTIKLDSGKSVNVLEQDISIYSAPKYNTNSSVAIKGVAVSTNNGSSIVNYRGKSGKVTWRGAYSKSNSNWIYNITLGDGTKLNQVLEQDIETNLKVVESKDINKLATINGSRNDGIFDRAPYGVAGYSQTGSTNSYNGWYAYVTKSQKLENGVTYYYAQFNGFYRWIDSRAFTNLRDMPSLVSENKNAQFNTLKVTSTDIRLGDPRWNKQTPLADANAIKNSNSAKSLSVKIVSIKLYSDGSSWANITQNNKDLGWVNVNDLEKPATLPEKPVTEPEKPVTKPEDKPSEKPQSDEFEVKIVNLDSETNKEISSSKVNLKKGSNTIKPKDIVDYNSPAEQTINLDKSQTVTFKYSYKYPNIRLYGTDVSKLNDVQKSWVESVLPSVDKVSSENGLYGSVMLSQAILETGYGQSDLAKEANNFFGIKAGSDWKGDIYTKETKEIVNGNEVVVKANFRKYPTIEAGMKGYADKVASGSSYGDKNFYKGLYATSNNNYVITARSLDGKWSTTPNYGDKLIDLIDRMSLFKLDKHAASQSRTSKLTIRAIDTKGKELWSEVKNVNLGSVETYTPKAVSGYNTPVAKAITMDQVGDRELIFNYTPSESVTSKDTTTRWHETKGSVALYADNFLTTKIGTVSGDITIIESNKLQSGKEVYNISQNGKPLGWISSNDSVKKEPIATIKEIDSKTKWLTTTGSIDLFKDNSLKNKDSKQITGNVTVSEVVLFTNGVRSAHISQNGSDLGWVDFNKLKAIPKPVTITSKDDNYKSWKTITKDTPIFTEALNGTQKSNTSSLKAKNITITKRYVLSDGTVMIYASQNNSVIGWINESSVGNIQK